ncbi:Long-chain-fatty-acid--CoA ligase 2 [Cyberlindnera fabianii]|uniref:Long-chain-fatty-acid--CoA ligase 2 n=1 Tax=Cyberlindnera fabianii TaxID=36022 RepID=A0A1V2L8Z4_CYBFA|nr:Long-chain-fatty-acid--CoA ligase 2 [Cyberlindnera fabianii]
MEKINELQKRLPLEKRHIAVPIPGTEKPGYTPIYHNATLGGEPLVDAISPELNTLTSLFTNAANKFPNDDCIGVRLFNNTQENKFDDFYTYESFATIRKRKNDIGAGIIHLVTNHPKYRSVTYNNGKPKFTVSILSPNRAEWMLVDMATRDVSLPNTALYPTLGRESSRYILEVTESPILFLTKNHISRVLDLKSHDQIPLLNILVSFDKFDHKDSELFTRAKSLGIHLTDFSSVEKVGSETPLPNGEAFNPPTPDTVFTYSFTSGTTGNPKGVILTHRIATCGIIACMTILHRPFPKLNMEKYLDCSNNHDHKGQQITALCALPLTHIYEREIANYGLCMGYRLCMLSDPSDPRAMFGDVKACKPHYLASVPRVWNKLEAAVKDVLKSQFNIEGSVRDAKCTDVDKLSVRNYLRELFGFENCNYLVTGSAPLGKETVVFLRDALCIGFAVAYGSTESFAGICFGDPFEKVVKNCSGPPAITCEVRLRDLSDIGYGVKDKPYPRGELMLRGPQIFSEYLKNEKATKESFDEDGWFHTGDVAALDPTGGVYIIDRVKNFFKLAQGEYVTPEKIENIYLASSPLLTQIFVHGDSLKSYLVGVAGISPEYVSDMLKRDHGITINHEDLLDLLGDQKFKRAVLQELNKHVANADLQGFEKVHNLHLDFEPLKVEDEVLTPTLKLKRENARKKFKNILEDLYNEGSLVKTNKL